MDNLIPVWDHLQAVFWFWLVWKGLDLIWSHTKCDDRVIGAKEWVIARVDWVTGAFGARHRAQPASAEPENEPSPPAALPAAQGFTQRPPRRRRPMRRRRPQHLDAGAWH
jgi:hypothetical protein